MKKIRILLDMDGVLVDFVGGVCKLFEISRDDLNKHWTLGEWNIVPPLGRAIGMRDAFNTTMFWNEINDGGEKFWLELEEMPWIDDLIKMVEDITDDWHIVTSPSYLPCSYSGKIKWLKNWFGDKFNRFAITPHKEIFAQENVILIDDRWKNIREFRESGGIGILFPSQGNLLHSRSEFPLNYLLNNLESLSNALKV